MFRPRLANQASAQALAPTVRLDELSGLRRLPKQPLTMNAAGMTDCGKVRKRNEDHFVIATLGGALWVHQSSLAQSSVQTGELFGRLMIVADGMGGHAGGEEASRLAITTVAEHVLRAMNRRARTEAPDVGPIEDLKDALVSAHTRVSSAAAANPDLRSMGTTLTLAYVQGNELHVVHAGDSRCYIFRDSVLRQITRDHTVVRDLVERGLIKPEEARKNPFAHLVTNAIGGTGKAVHVEAHSLELRASDVILLTSDGLHDFVADEAIAEVLRRDRTPSRACAKLIDLANRTGGYDNITVVAAEFADADPSAPNP